MFLYWEMNDGKFIWSLWCIWNNCEAIEISIHCNQNCFCSDFPVNFNLRWNNKYSTFNSICIYVFLCSLSPPHKLQYLNINTKILWYCYVLFNILYALCQQNWKYNKLICIIPNPRNPGSPRNLIQPLFPFILFFYIFIVKAYLHLFKWNIVCHAMLMQTLPYQWIIDWNYIVAIVCEIKLLSYLLMQSIVLSNLKILKCPHYLIGNKLKFSN